MSRREGARGEALVANYLRERHYKLLAAGYRCRFGEIDLVAMDGDTLCFVEIKTRTNIQMALPREYVTKGKQSKLKKTAQFYLMENPHYQEIPCRFDVAEVYAEEGYDKARIKYWEAAFE